MKPGRFTAVLLALVLLGCALCAARVAAALGAVGLEFGRARTASLEPALAGRVAQAPGGLLVQWFATPAERLPSEYAAVEQAVRALFPALEAAAPGRVRTQILHPESDPEAARYAAALGLVPFRARRIEHDAWRESELWSSLRIVHGARGAAVVRALTPELARDLQPLIAAHLAEIERPRRPVVALSAPPGHAKLRALLDTLADVREIDYDADARIPPDADLLFWIAPARADARHAARLASFLERGGSAFVAASRWTASYGPGELRFEPTGAPLDLLLPELGLSANPSRVLEAPAPEAEARADHAWHLLRSIGSRQDFRALGSQPNGTLAFAAPSPAAPLADRLLELGYAFSALASSSDRCFQVPADPATLRLEDLARGDVGTALPAQTLLAHLAPLDPTRGSLVYAASAALLSDASLDDPAFVHRELVRTLVRGLASPERRALSALARARPVPLPELSRAERWTWRGACVLLVPALLVLAGALRGAFRFGGASWTAGGPALAALAVVAAGLAAAALPARLGLDASAEGVNRLAPELTAIARQVAARTPLAIETCFSERQRLPPEMRAGADAARDLCAALARSAADVDTTDLAPDGLAQEDAAARGLRTLRGTSQREEGLASHAFFAAIVLRAGGQRAVLEFPDAAAFDHLAFRVAVALHTLAAGRAPRVAVASDPLRMTPAEALEFYQKRGLFAPGASDPFAAARALLVRHGFEIAPVDGRADRVPEDVDAFVWFQPRRDASRRATALARHLARGGRALVFAQPLRVRPRQRDDGRAEATLWPEPLFPDLDRLYLPSIGVQIAPEVVFDEHSGSLEIEGTAERGGQVFAARATVSNALIVRSTPAGRPATPFTDGVGDLLLPSPAHLRLDHDRLRELDLAARAVLTTSERAWTYPWTGGMLPRESLPPPGARVDRLVLAARIAGTFPGPEVDPALGAARDDAVTAARGELVLVACSEPFTDANLRLAEYDHARFVLQATAALALPADVQAVLARRASAGGFRLVEPSQRLAWRAFGLAAGPLLLLVGVAFWRRARARRLDAQVRRA